MNTRKWLLAAGLLMLGALNAGCGGSDSESSPKGNDTDRAFAAEMIAHHESAVEMGQLARTKGEHAEVRNLGSQIVKTQTAEIDRLDLLGQAVGVKSSGGPTLGLSEAQMGMSHDPGELRQAGEFDREFIEMMTAHHEGAIRMARIELEKGENPDLQKLARNVIAAQEKEVSDMKMWRTEWYGDDEAGGMHGTSTESEGGHDG